MADTAFQFTHKDAVKTAIPLGPDSISLPKGMFQSGKVPGTIVEGRTAAPWYWEGIKSINGMLCVYSSTKNLKPLSMLFNLNISLSTRLELFLQVLEGLELIRKTSDDPWFIRSFPITALWIIPNSGLLLLPKSISSVMMNSVSEKQREALQNTWIHPKAPEDQLWLYQMVSVLYTILGKVPPLEDENVREAGYSPLPLWTLNPSVSDEFSQRIMGWLTLKQGLPEPEELSALVREHKGALCSPAVKTRTLLAEEQKNLFSRNIRKRGRRQVFLRKRGFILLTAAVLTVLLSAGIITRVIEASRPPVFAGLEAEEFIAYYYQLQDELNMGEIGDLLTRSVRNTREEQMIYLHVTNAMRTAYGGGSMIPASTWIEQGKPDIPADMMVYGITDLEITKVSHHVYDVEFILWLPAAQDPDSPQDSASVDAVRYVERIHLTDRESHYLIENIEVRVMEPLT